MKVLRVLQLEVLSSNHGLCLQAEEKRYELMGGCGQQRFLQEYEGESAPRCWTDVVYSDG